MNIYTPIKPTRLYIKQHSITKKKYFGKTSLLDPIKYLGSGSYWKDHINKHGKEFVETIWVSDFYYDTSISEHALHFSSENNIIKSDAWANLIPENGLDGTVSGVAGRKASEETRAKMSAARKGKPLSEETKAKLSANHIGKNTGPQSPEHIAKRAVSNTGNTRSVETKNKMSAASKGIPKSEEHKASLSAAHKGKPLSDETKAKRAATRAANKVIKILVSSQDE